MLAYMQIASVIAATLAVVEVPGQAMFAQKPKPDIFADAQVMQIHLTIPAKEYDAMQPPGGGFGFPGGFGGPMNPPPKKEVKRDVDRSVFGTEFPWVHGTFIANGMTIENVGLRYKGNSTYMATARGLKRSMKVDFDHYNENQRFGDHKTLNLHCGVHDPSKIREMVTYSLLRASGVPAPRTTLAEVTLTVPGKYDKEYLGLYTVTEQINKSFLKMHYKNDKGLLMKPERIRSLDYLGEDWERYKTTYQPKREATKEEQKRVIDFAKLVNQGSDEQFRKEVATYLDIGSFLRFLAATAMVSNLDSFFTNGHNYYLYLHPETNKLHFIPWDVDLAMGNFAFYGTADQQMDLSLMKPYLQSRLPDRLLAMKEYNERYQQILKELAPVFTKERMLKEIEGAEAATKSLIAKDSKAAADRKEGGVAPGFGPPGGAGMFGQPPEMKKFAEKRAESIAAQLAGKSKGYVPQFGGFGPPGGMGAPGGFGPGNQIAGPLLNAFDSNKDGKLSDAEFAAGMKRFFSEWDVNKDGLLDQKEIADGLQKLIPAPKGGPFGPPPKP